MNNHNVGCREACCFLSLNFGIHILLFLLQLPMAHADLSAYVEPGIQIALTGKICGPASQYQDLTAVDGYYFYPPGFFLITALWVKAFGFAAKSLLTMTLLTHFLWITSLWWILRTRVQAQIGISLLAICSAFPMINHGRPDMLALLFGSGAWLALPVQGESRARLVLASVFSALSGYCSPVYGIGSSAAIAGYLILHTWQVDPSWKRVVKNVILLSANSMIAFTIMLFFTLIWQNNWELARIQWHNHSSIRSAELNVFPDLMHRYAIVNCAIPLIFFAIVPILLTLIQHRKLKACLPFVAATAFEGLILFALAKTYYIIAAHVYVLSRSPFQASLGANPMSRTLRLFGIAGLLYYTFLNWNINKIQFMPIVTNNTQYSQEVASLKLPETAVMETDSHFFLQAYRPGKTLAFEIEVFMNRWMKNRSLTPPELLSRAVPESLRDGPMNPDVILISALSVISNPPSKEYILLTPEPLPQLHTIWGKPVGYCDDPLKPCLYVRADKLDELLPAIRQSSLPLNR